MKIDLRNNGGKRWECFEKSFVKGFAFLGNEYLDERAIYDQLINSILINNVENTVGKLNGNFSAVIVLDGRAYLFADKLKTYPLLYSKIDDEYLITDQSTVILDSLTSFNPDEKAIVSYLGTGYLHGNRTFLKDCFIVSAGTYVMIDHSAEIIAYHKHIYDKVEVPSQEMMQRCMTVIENSIKRMVESIGEKPIWIPLSGGYDSRLIACVCKKLNVSNVKCFTYGIVGSPEIAVSNKVAKQLGFPWYCVEYSKEKLLNATKSLENEEYIFWGMNLNTTAHFQDFVAIKELLETGVMEDNAVIVPGHSGEILGRDQVPYNLLNAQKSVAELLFYRYFQWNIIKKEYESEIISSLGRTLNQSKAIENKGNAIDLFTNWNVQNRQANFIVNAVRVYEYFDLEWRVPLWDDELSYFWFSLDYTINSNVGLYNEFVFTQYFHPMNVAFYKEKSAVLSWAAKVRLPFGIKDKIKSKLVKLKYFKRKYDENGLNGIIKFHLSKISSPVPSGIILKNSNANAVLAMYQIDLMNDYIRNRKKIKV